jgi:hypothetical protein
MGLLMKTLATSDTVLLKTSRKYEEGNLWKPYGWHPMETIRLATNAIRLATIANHSACTSRKTSSWQPIVKPSRCQPVVKPSSWQPMETI